MTTTIPVRFGLQHLERWTTWVYSVQISRMDKQSDEKQVKAFIQWIHQPRKKSFSGGSLMLEYGYKTAQGLGGGSSILSKCLDPSPALCSVVGGMSIE